jgi:hypothetical protein
MSQKQIRCSTRFLLALSAESRLCGPAPVLSALQDIRIVVRGGKIA